jgi:hypothetical protein
VADTYLRADRASTAVVTHVSGASELAQRGIELTRQDLL